jgi:hypothetical protein
VRHCHQSLEKGKSKSEDYLDSNHVWLSASTVLLMFYSCSSPDIPRTSYI